MDFSGLESETSILTSGISPLKLVQLQQFAKKNLEMSKFGTENALCEIFWTWVWQKLFWYLKSVPSNLPNSEIFWTKTKKILGGKIHYSGSSELKIYKFFVIFEINSLEFVYLQECTKKKKKSKFRTKKALFGFFWARNWNKYCHISNQHPRLCLIWNFFQKSKNIYFWHQKIFIRVFWS